MCQRLLMLALCTVLVPAQTPTFQITSQLVIETVVVKDAHGRVVSGLHASDFAVAEDGVPQQIKFFEEQKLDDVPDAVAAVKTKDPRPEAFQKLPRTRIAAESGNATRYRDRRLLALYFDLTAMLPADQARAITAAQQFIRHQATPADLIALMGFSGGAVRVLQDFTADRIRLDRILETMLIGEGEGQDENAHDADTGAAFGQDDSEFNVFNTDRQLSALQTAAKMLGQLSEKKALVYFGSGLRLNGNDNQAQLRATINAAIRAGVSFWPIDARGLVAQAPLGDATQGSAGGVAMYTGGAAADRQSSFQRSQDTLWSLAADTGGRALLDSNDLAAGMRQAQRSFSSYYIVGYYATNAAPDGKLRKVKITLNSWLSARLEYRQSYYAAKEFAKFNAADKERQLEDALMLEDPITELTLALELDYFQLNRAEYFVPLTVKVPGGELALARRGGADHTRIDFIGEVKDEYGTTVRNVRDKIDVKLAGATAAALARRAIEYDTGFTLLPGKYVAKFLARDAETGRIGTYQTSFTVPNLNRENARIPISSVVLASERVDLKDALYNALKEKDRAELANPLVHDGHKLIPNIARVFHRNREMYVYFEAYQPNAPETRPLLAYMTFYRDGVKQFETVPQRVVSAQDNTLKTMPVKLSVPLEQLVAGEYTCQLTLLDSQARKAAFWRTGIMVIP